MKIYLLLVFFAIILLSSGKDLPFDIATASNPVSHYQCIRQKYVDLGLFVSTSQAGISDASR